jgi:hypothetical protein
MIRLNGFAALLFIALSFINCKKDSASTPAADIAGRIDFTLPIAGSIYDNGLVLKTEGGMNDDNGLASAKVEIRNKTTGAILFQQTSATGNVTFYRFLWNWTVTGITGVIPATVKVIAIDKLSNQIFKEVDITLTN